MPTDEDKEPEVTEPKGDRPQWVDEILAALKPKETTEETDTLKVPLPPEPEDDDLEDDELEEPEDEPKPKASFWSKIW